MTSRRSFLALSAMTLAVPAALAAAALDAAPAAAQKAPVYATKGIAVSGYDPVAYFTEQKPVPGKPEIAAEHQGAKYYFSTEANRDAFKKEPAKFAPQYGGYCAWAVSQGYTASADPKAWTIVGGRLFLNYNQSVKKDWEKNIPGNVAKADANWPKVLAK